jgi:Protein kinase domain
MQKLEAGRTIGGYRIEARIGRGGMGVVYRATHIALDRQVALKVIAEELAEDEGFRERFRREPKLAASIDHANVIPVFDAGEVDEHLFVAMRYVQGSDLRSVITDEGRLAPDRAVSIVAQVASGLDAAHELGLVHRDVKPANVLIENRAGREHVYLTDFGLTKGGEGSTALTKTGQWVGTPDYVAPEQIHGGMLDRRTDIYALGAVLYHAMAGQPPYGRETEVAKIYAHLSRPPPELPGDVDAPSELKETIRRAMAKEPADRYATAGELGRHALAAVETRPAGSTRLAAPPAIPTETRAETEAVTPDSRSASVGAEVSAERSVPPTRAVRPDLAAGPSETALETGPTVAAEAGELGPAAADAPSAPRPAGAPRSVIVNRRRVVALGSLGVVVLAVAGFLIGSSGGDSDSPSLSSSASAGTVELRFPSTWQRAGEAVAVPGISFNRPIALEPAGDAGGAGLKAGPVDAVGPTLLPERFLRLLGGKRPSGEPVELGRLEAIRYTDLEPKGFEGALTVFAVPTTNGVATTACAAPPGTSETVANECEQIAGSLRLVNANAFPLEPDKAYASVLNRTIDDLNEARDKQLEQAREAKSPDVQAAALDALAASYDDAAGRLSEVSISPAVKPANAAIVSALSAGADAYRGMAGAARANQEGAYEAAGDRAREADAELQRALARLQVLGYEVG